MGNFATSVSHIEDNALLSSSSEMGQAFDMTPVWQWTCETVNEWLRDNQLFNCAKILSKQKTNGLVLILLNDQELIEWGLNDSKDRETLLRSINDLYLGALHCPLSEQENVRIKSTLQKLKKLSKCNKKTMTPHTDSSMSSVSDDDFVAIFSRYLSIEQHMLRSYLSMNDWRSSRKLIEMIRDVYLKEALEELVPIGPVHSKSGVIEGDSNVTTKMEPSLVYSLTQKLSEMLNEMSMMENDKKKNQVQYHHGSSASSDDYSSRGSGCYDVHLVIFDQQNHDGSVSDVGSVNVIDCVLPVLMNDYHQQHESKNSSHDDHSHNTSSMSGAFRVGLLVGPCLLRWDETSLIVPKRLYSHALTIMKESSVKIGELRQLDALAEVLCQWNSSHYYDSHQRNCVHFVEAVVAKLGLELNAGDSLLSFLNQVKINGYSSVVFGLTPDLQKLLNMSETQVSFSSHQELDEFVKKILMSNKKYFFSHPGDWVILKSLDRSFWLQYVHCNSKDMSAERWRPLKVDSVKGTTSCPFDHPFKNKQ